MTSKFEYGYLFGLDLDLSRYNLGKIQQPKLIDFIDKGLEVEEVYFPFLMNDYIIENSGDKITYTDIKNQMGSLHFLFTTCYQSGRGEVISSLLNSLKFIYKTEKVTLGNQLDIVIDDIRINNDNFDILSSVVLEMFKIDKSKMDFKNKEKDLYAGLTKEMIEAKKKFLERTKGKTKKNDSITILDLANVVIHSGNLVDYKSVLDMTIFQIKNSVEVINSKEAYEFSNLVRVSPKFDTSKEKYEHWTEKIKLDKSILSQ